MSTTKKHRIGGQPHMPNFTRQAIKASFIKLLGEMPLSKISVRSIVEDCGINRNSFYYHFEDIPSLIEEIIKEDVDALIAQCSSITSMEDCVRLAFQFATQNKKAVMHLYDSASRDIYEAYTMKICEYVVTSYIETVFGNRNIPEKNRAIIVRFFKCELYGLVSEWIAGGMPDSALDDASKIAALTSTFIDVIEREYSSAE